MPKGPENLRQLLAPARVQAIKAILNNGPLTKRNRAKIARLMINLPSPYLRFIYQYLKKKK